MEVIIQILKHKIAEGEENWNREFEEEQGRGLYFEEAMKIEEIDITERHLMIIGQTTNESISVELYIPLWELIEHVDVNFLKRLSEAFNARKQKLETILKKEVE